MWRCDRSPVMDVFFEEGKFQQDGLYVLEINARSRAFSLSRVQVCDRN